MGHRIAVLQRRRPAAARHPQTLYDRPANLFVAGFIGSPAMNLVDARLERDERSSCPAAVFGTHRLLIPAQVAAAHPALENIRARASSWVSAPRTCRTPGWRTRPIRRRSSSCP